MACGLPRMTTGCCRARGAWLTERASIGLGRIVLFRMTRGRAPQHLGLIATETSFIHAYAGRAVSESVLARWWRARIAHIFAFPGAD